MIFRQMSISDYEQMYDLWINTVGMGLNNIDDSIEGIEKFLKRNPATCFVAEKNEKIIGTILAGHDGRRGFIYHTTVDKNSQKQGIGRKLVGLALDSLEKEGISKVALVVFGKNLDGNEFWEKLGFKTRNDLVYRNKSLIELIRIDT